MRCPFAQSFPVSGIVAGVKQPVRKLDEDTVRRDFPIADRVPGWFFRVDEVSNGAYRAIGTDLWGRRTETAGSDPEHALADCIDWARRRPAS
jgi:hypothetical protein